MIILPYFTRSLSSMNLTVCFSVKNELYLVFKIIFSLFFLFVCLLFYLQIFTLCSLVNYYVTVIKRPCCNNGNTIQTNRYQKLFLNQKILESIGICQQESFKNLVQSCMSQMYSNTQCPSKCYIVQPWLFI